MRHFWRGTSPCRHSDELVARRPVTRIQGNPDARADDETTPPPGSAGHVASTAMALRSTSALLRVNQQVQKLVTATAADRVFVARMLRDG
jgi:hypothetical protein